VSLFPEVQTDVREIDQLARQLTRASDAGADIDFDHKPFCGELLVGWYDEWTLVERERVRQLCLHALESLALLLLSRRRYAQALESALAAIAFEPLRESAHRVIIQIHLAEGNHYEGVRHYEQFSMLLEEELGLTPTPTMEKLLTGLEARLREMRGSGCLP
jgi:DNA-binding SARP family transcriptional activator